MRNFNNQKRSKMKKLFYLFLAGALVFGVQSCGSQSGSEAEEVVEETVAEEEEEEAPAEEEAAEGEEAAAE